MSRTLIYIGAILILLGLFWPTLQRLGLGRLPGDIVIKRENFSFHFPVTTMIAVSVALSVILSILFRLFNK